MFSFLYRKGDNYAKTFKHNNYYIWSIMHKQIHHCRYICVSGATIDCIYLKGTDLVPFIFFTKGEPKMKRIFEHYIPESYCGSIKDCILYLTDYRDGVRASIHKIVKKLFGDYGE